jgi:simple sugar transport system ATP-binding protein
LFIILGERVAEPFLFLKNISKHYSGVTALNSVNFHIDPGEIHCLVGENGSGKSTLIKIISGTVTPDQGSIIEIEGQPVHNYHEISAIHRGIQVIYQDLSLFPNLTVAENIALGKFVANRRKLFNWSELRQISEQAMARINVRLPLDELAGKISIADQQLVAICRALTWDVKLLIMDEPTASLTKKEVDSLFSVVMDMRSKGIATMFVSHKLNEVLQIADRISVLRDGKMVGTYNSGELDDDRLTFLMTGKKVEYEKFFTTGSKEAPILEVCRLSKKGEFKDITFRLFPGEILGLTGLLGSGRTETALAIFGVTHPDAGEIFFEGKPVVIRNIQDAIRLGIGYVPEDRLVEGLIMNQPVGKNLIITFIETLLNRFKLLDPGKVENSIQAWVKELAIKIPSIDSPVQTLSGGNQQRVVLAKWIATNPKVLILDGPTIGIDVAAKRAIHEIIRSLAQKGIAILLISEEISEVYNNCNRILVMKKGCIAGEFDTDKVSQNDLQEFVNQIN